MWLVDGDCSRFRWRRDSMIVAPMVARRQSMLMLTIGVVGGVPKLIDVECSQFRWKCGTLMLIVGVDGSVAYS